MIEQDRKTKERVRIEITTNTIRHLAYSFDRLLCGMDTKKHEMTVREQEKTIKSIKSFIFYRLHEKIIPKNTELWILLESAYDSQLKTKEEVEPIYLKLIKLMYEDKYVLMPDKPRLNYPKSQYYAQKARELGKKEGEKIVSKFFKKFKL